MKNILVALLMLLPNLAQAKEEVLAEEAVMTKGLLCEQSADVAQLLSLLDDGVPQEQAFESVPGCGVLISPVPVKVVAIGKVVTGKFEYLLVRYTVLLDMTDHYGIYARKPLPSGA